MKNKIKKVIVIDSLNKTVYEKDTSTLQDLQNIVGGMIEHAHQLRNGDSVFVNEEGLFNDAKDFFIFEDGCQPFAGNGFVIGDVDDDGDSTEVKSSVTKIKALVQFVDILTIRQMVSMGKL